MTQSSDRLPPVLLLAAGVGRRLGEMTAALPKAMIEVKGVALLERSLRALEAAGFPEAVIVTGHASGTIDGFLRSRSGAIRTRSVFNPRYAETNNIVSMLAAADSLRSGFCLLNTDIIFDPSLLVDVQRCSDGVWLVVDGDEPLGAEEMKVELDDTGHMSRISKTLDPAISVGEYIGIVRFDARGAEVVLRSAQNLVASGGSNLYYEDAMDHAAAALHARVVPTARRAWTEIDDLADLERAQHVAAVLDGSGTANL